MFVVAWVEKRFIETKGDATSPDCHHQKYSKVLKEWCTDFLSKIQDRKRLKRLYLLET